MSEVRTWFIKVTEETETVNYLCNESGDSSVIFDDLTEILDILYSLFRRQEFLNDWL